MGERTFAMPDLGEGLEEGRIVEWLVAEGDTVALNQPLVEVETAKAAVEIPSPFAGRVVTLHEAAGADVPVGAALVTFEVEGSSGGPARAAPPVRRLAKDLGVDIETVAGTSATGRVSEDDVRRMAERMAAVPGATASTSTEDLRSGQEEVTDVRRSIAASLERRAAIPQVTTFRTVDCTALDGLRRELEVSPLPILLAALCRTIDDHPLLNARWTRDAVETRGKINVGLAVDTDRGLVVPVLQDAGRRGIDDLAAEIRRLAESARDGSMHIDDLVPTSTIAVSNTGSYGSEAGTPILAPGTGVTLAFGVIAPRALVVDGAVVARPAATISCTFDHRVMDGATAGRALSDLVALLESADRLGGLPR